MLARSSNGEAGLEMGVERAFGRGFIAPDILVSLAKGEKFTPSTA